MGVGRAFPEHHIRDLVAAWIVGKSSALGFDVAPRGLVLETLACGVHSQNCLVSITDRELIEASGMCLEGCGARREPG